MRRILLFILIAIFVTFAFSMNLSGVKNIKIYRDYTLAYEIFTEHKDTNRTGLTIDTFYYYLPVVDTTIDTNMYGEVDTTVEETYPWPSVYDQNSYEALADSADAGAVWHTYDRWAMEDWALAFFIADSSNAGLTHSITAYIQYQFPGAPAWTVRYNLFAGVDAQDSLLTYYPLDLYDNWKLYRNARIMVTVEEESVWVYGWLVGRQILRHRHVDPGE